MGHEYKPAFDDNDDPKLSNFGVIVVWVIIVALITATIAATVLWWVNK